MKNFNYRALVIEDDPAWREMLAEILRDEGMAVDHAGHLGEARQHIRASPHRLAIVDLSLGGRDHNNRDGLAVLDFIRKHDPGCVSVLLTGYATVEIAVSALREQGAFSCLRKEKFRRADFRALIDQALAYVPGEPQIEPTRQRALQPAGSVPPPPAPGGDALLVEDDAGWRKLLSELLAEAGFQVQTCGSYAEAQSWLQHASYRLAVLDLSLASSLAAGDNLDGARLLRITSQAGIPAIIVSGHASPEHLDELIERYQPLACLEKQYFSRQSFLRFCEQTRLEAVQAPEAALTRREAEVLQGLLQGLSNAGMAQALGVSVNTIKRHLKSIYKKYGVHSRAAVVAKALQAGGPRTVADS